MCHHRHVVWFNANSYADIITDYTIVVNTTMHTDINVGVNIVMFVIMCIVMLINTCGTFNCSGVRIDTFTTPCIDADIDIGCDITISGQTRNKEVNWVEL